MSRFRGQGTSERSKHVGTIIVLLAQPLPSRVTSHIIITSHIMALSVMERRVVFILYKE
jgi:hypothetical protein